MRADPAASALFLGAFFDELERWGVHDVVQYGRLLQVSE